MATSSGDLGTLEVRAVEMSTNVATAVVSSVLPGPLSAAQPAAAQSAAAAAYHRQTWSARHGGLLMLLELGAMFAAGLLLDPAIAWVCVTTLFVCFLVTAGKMTGGRYSTALIDERNLM